MPSAHPDWNRKRLRRELRARWEWRTALNHYHLVFAASLVMRLACQPLLRRIREPGAKHSRQLLGAMMDEWPMSVVRFPVGLFRRGRGDSG